MFKKYLLSVSDWAFGSGFVIGILFGVAFGGVAGLVTGIPEVFLTILVAGIVGGVVLGSVQSLLCCKYIHREEDNRGLGSSDPWLIQTDDQGRVIAAGKVIWGRENIHPVRLPAIVFPDGEFSGRVAISRNLGEVRVSADIDLTFHVPNRDEAPGGLPNGFVPQELYDQMIRSGGRDVDVEDWLLARFQREAEATSEVQQALERYGPLQNAYQLAGALRDALRVVPFTTGLSNIQAVDAVVVAGSLILVNKVTYEAG